MGCLSFDIGKVDSVRFEALGYNFVKRIVSSLRLADLAARVSLSVR